MSLKTLFEVERIVSSKFGLSDLKTIETIGVVGPELYLVHADPKLGKHPNIQKLLRSTSDMNRRCTPQIIDDLNVVTLPTVGQFRKVHVEASFNLGHILEHRSVCLLGKQGLLDQLLADREQIAQTTYLPTRENCVVSFNPSISSHSIELAVKAAENGIKKYILRSCLLP